MADGTLDNPNHFLTPATVMTISRPLIGFEIGRRLITGEENVTPLMMAVGASDGEGFVARYIDKHFPESGRGSTELGKALDPIADTIALLEIAGAALKAPRVSKLGKAAVGTILASESIKTIWAAYANSKHILSTGNQLVITPSRDGKAATASKFVALTAAVATHDCEPGTQRTTLGWLAIGMALSGIFLGEKARRGYAEDLRTKKT
jgi:hypothetical protein